MLEENFKNFWAYQNSQRVVARREEDLSSTRLYHQNTYLITQWSRGLLEKLTDSQLVKKFPTFYGTRRFITPHSQVHATCPYPEQARSSPCPHIPLPEDPTSYYPPIYAWVFQAVSFPSGFPIKTLYTPLLCPIRSTYPTHLILLARSEAPLYVS